MFILKLQKDDYQKIISCIEFDSDVRGDMAFIIANGVQYQVGGDNPEIVKPYDVCFVENDFGKTVNRIGPFTSLKNTIAANDE